MLALFYITGCTPIVSAILSPRGVLRYLFVLLQKETVGSCTLIEYTVRLFAIEHSITYTHTKSCSLSIVQ